MKTTFFILWWFTCPFTLFRAYGEEIRNPDPLKRETIGERIAFWRGNLSAFLMIWTIRGTFQATIVSDGDWIVCIWLSEQWNCPKPYPWGGIQVALEEDSFKRCSEDGHVVNYDDRFEYGKICWDGKWGKEITSSVGKTMKVKDQGKIL